MVRGENPLVLNQEELRLTSPLNSDTILRDFGNEKGSVRFYCHTHRMPAIDLFSCGKSFLMLLSGTGLNWPVNGLSCQGLSSPVSVLREGLSR